MKSIVILALMLGGATSFAAQKKQTSQPSRKVVTKAASVSHREEEKPCPFRAAAGLRDQTNPGAVADAAKGAKRVGGVQ